MIALISVAVAITITVVVLVVWTWWLGRLEEREERRESERLQQL